jgi:hypothetical protein
MIGERVEMFRFGICWTRHASKFQHGLARSKLASLIMHSFCCSMQAIGACALIPISAISLFAATEGKNADRAILHCGAKIECIRTDGARQNTHPSVTAVSDDSVSCPLSEGETTFVVTLPRSGNLERLKFVSENVAARGTLKIAVSNEELPADSARWRSVDGNVSFHHKRLFDLSMVGLEAKFVRVTFNVERETGTREFTLASESFESAQRVLFGANPAAGRQTLFGDHFVLPNAAPLIAALEP